MQALIPQQFPVSTGIPDIDSRLQKINMTQTAIAALGGASIIAGVNLYKYAKPINDENLQLLSSALFIGGWLIIALAISGGTWDSLTLSLKNLIAFVSAVAVIAGAMMERQKLDTAAGQNGDDLGMALFLAGWAGIGVAMAMDSDWAMEKIIATIAAIGVTLGGVYWTAQLETSQQNQMPGKILFGAGWVLMALAIGFAG